MFDIVFEYPFVFLLIPIFILGSIYLKVPRDSIYFPYFDFVKFEFKKKFLLTNILKWLGILALITALASPVFENDRVSNESEGYAISLLLDASGSMRNPISNKERRRSKFDISKDIVRDFVKKRKYDHLGFVVFGDFAYVASPLTFDKDSLADIVSRMRLGIAGTQTAIFEALASGVNTLKKSEAKQKFIILLTDGENTQKSIPLDVVLKMLKKHKIKVYTVGIGDGIKKNVLSHIARESGGKFFVAKSIRDLKSVYKNIDKLEKSKITSYKFVLKDYLYYIPLGVSLVAFSWLGVL